MCRTDAYLRIRKESPEMKKSAALVLVFAVMLSLAACGRGGAPKTADNAKRIGIAMPTKSLERWSRDGAYLRDQFQKEGCHVRLAYADNDTAQQRSDIRNMIEDDVDILIVAAVDGEALTQVLGDAKKAGIPVIAYDRLIMNTDAVSYYVSFDNYTVGALQGTYVAQALDLPNAGDKVYNIEFTAGDPADNNARYFFSGAYDVLAPYLDAGTLRVRSNQTAFEQAATAQWNSNTAMTRMKHILEVHYSGGTDLDAVLCANDSTALGVSRAIESGYRGDGKPIITGQDADTANLRNIVDGVQSMTVFKNIADEAVVTLELAKAILDGSEPAEELLGVLDVPCDYDTESYHNGVAHIPSYLLVPSVITAENLQELVDTGLYTWDGAYLVSTAN